MPVNPRLIVISDDNEAMIADVARELIDRNRERINTRIYYKLLFYGLLILTSFGTTWSTTRSHADAFIVLMRDIAGVAAMELAWFAIARVYTVRASQASNLSALVVLLSWRYAPARCGRRGNYTDCCVKRPNKAFGRTGASTAGNSTGRRT